MAVSAGHEDRCECLPARMGGEDTKDPGLHASFKLSRSGETVYLTDVDGRQILDSITFPESKDDEAFGRLPDTTEIQPVSPTPGAQNKPHE